MSPAALLPLLLIVFACADPDEDVQSPATIDSVAQDLITHGRMEEAAQLVRDGITAHPDAASLYARQGYIHRYAGLLDRSISLYRRAQALDSAPAALADAEDQIAKSLIYLGDYAGAIKSHRRIDAWLAELERKPDGKLLFYRGIAHFYAGERAEAVRLFDAAHETSPGTLWTRFAQAYKHGALGDRKRLLEVATSLERRDDVADGERRYRLVHLFALGGEPVSALRHLTASVDAGFFNYPYIKSDPWLENIRVSDEFAVALERARTRHSAFEANHD